MNLSRLNTIFMAIFLTLFFALAANASSYSELREDANSKTSDVYDLYSGSAETIQNEISISSISEPPDYSDLLAKYETASSRDPLGTLLERFPVASRFQIEEYQVLDREAVASNLNSNVDEELILAVLLARSPRLARAEEAWRATLNRYPQTFYLQDILNRYQAFTEGMSLGIGREYQRGMVQMNYASPGMLTLRGRVVELDIEIAWNEYIREGAEIIADTKSLLAEIQNKNELISINAASASRLSVLSSVVEAQYVAGTRSFSDLVRIRTELAIRRDMVERTKSMRDGLYGRLAAMLDLPVTTAFGEFTWTGETNLDLSTENLSDEIIDTRPELIQIALGVEKMDAMIEMTLLRADADQTFGFTYFQGRDVQTLDGGMDSSDTGGMDGMDMGDGSDTGEMDMNFMNRPMVDHRGTDTALDLAWAMEIMDRRNAMREMLQAKTDMATGMLAMQIERYKRSVESTGVSRGRVIPNSRAALDVVRAGYTAQENNFNDLIMAELTLLMARMDLSNFELDRRLSLAEIGRLMGHTID